MPNYTPYAGIYATSFGPAAGLGASDVLTNPSNQWVSPPTSEEQQQGYYWDWATESYQKKPMGGQSAPGTPGSPSYIAGQQPPTGVPVPYSPGQTINPNDPNQRYKPVTITKQPDVASAEGSLMDSFKQGAADSMKGFNDWLSTFKSSLGTAFGQSQQATNPTGTINSLQTQQNRYSAALDKSAADYRTLNQNTATAEQGIVKQAQDLIPQYDQAAQDAVNQQMAALQKNVSRYKSVSGTPTGLGSGEEQILSKGAADILVPMEQAKVQQRYNVLSNYAMPVALDIANREQARIGTFDPMVAQQQFQTGQATAQTIQQLRVITSQMARNDAIAFLQAVSVPTQIQQQILSGQIQQAGALSQLEGQANYSGLQDILGTNLTPSLGYSMNMGSYPNGNRYRGAGGGNMSPAGYTQATGGAWAPNAPLQVAPAPADGSGSIQTPYGNMSPWRYDANNQRYVNIQTGQFAPAQQGDPRFAGGDRYAPVQVPAYDPSNFDPDTGAPYSMD